MIKKKEKQNTEMVIKPHETETTQQEWMSNL